VGISITDDKHTLLAVNIDHRITALRHSFKFRVTNKQLRHIHLLHNVCFLHVFSYHSIESSIHMKC